MQGTTGSVQGPAVSVGVMEGLQCPGLCVRTEAKPNEVAAIMGGCSWPPS